MTIMVLNGKFLKSWLLPILFFCLVVFGLWQLSRLENKMSVPQSEQFFEIAEVDEPIQPIPLELDLDKRKVELGEKLFHDPQLSRDNTVSCASCHELDKGGTDQLVVSLGINGQTSLVNSPTVFNSGFNFKQFWDGRVTTLEEQIDSLIKGERSMGSNWQEIVTKLQQSPEYVSMFKTLYSGKINRDNINDAIATYERSLITPNSRFDQFLRGDDQALTSEEKDGYRRFKTYGCVVCHQGINVGGNMFHGFGLFGNYFKDRGNITEADYGRYNVTGQEKDRYVFKVPSLRNIVLTAPYFHDGSAETLEEAVKIMGKYQLGRELSPEDIELIVQFLQTLTGEYRLSGGEQGTAITNH